MAVAGTRIRECHAAARINGLTDREMRIEERSYALRIDAIYARLKQAESRAAA
jgi:hypothetical protein